jgi:hypothetical protein
VSTSEILGEGITLSLRIIIDFTPFVPPNQSIHIMICLFEGGLPSHQLDVLTGKCGGHTALMSRFGSIYVEDDIESII